MNIAITSRYRDRGSGVLRFREWECVPRTFSAVADEHSVNLVSISTNSIPKDILSLCDGLILTGSCIDIDPHVYGVDDPDFTETIDEYSMDKQLVDFFYSRNRPILGVCGGMQALNVAFGGSLKQVGGHSDIIHGVTIEGTNFLTTLFGDDLKWANSYHNYAIDKLGEGLHVAAKSCDGVIEAVESSNKRLLGVQWHPEEPYVCSNGEKCNNQFDKLMSYFFFLCEV